MSDNSTPGRIASIQQRLLNIARQQQRDFQSVLVFYGLERLLYRLGCSRFASQFVLKGALLFTLWGGAAKRPTRDLDLLQLRVVDGPEMETIFREVASLSGNDDGLVFQTNSVRSESIREAQNYGGIRIHLIAVLGNARIPLQIDVGFGDVVTPAAQTAQFPLLLPDLPAPMIQVYSRETVIAEKYQAMVALGFLNSRMKDFYDVWNLAQRFVFQGPVLQTAIRATFARRAQAIPQTEPVIFTDGFSGDSYKTKQWTAFLKKAKLADAPSDLAVLIRVLQSFLWPITESINTHQPFVQRWQPGGPWRT